QGQGKCPKCGADLTHNAAYHTNQGGAAGENPANAIQVNPSNMQMTTVTAPPTTVSGSATPPPGQNAAGVWHYVCPNGHAEGGSGSQGSCPKCGTALTHNQAYHNQ